ncbi:MAG: heme lyase CcmF/NrfE family subunit [Alphaproteobacteria bacterium]|nr:heme lyase CcmF/NrfE family subunit [Alphaproteobacteria bacterium]
MLGRAAVLVALAACAIGAVAGLYGGAKRSAAAEAWARAMAGLFFAATATAVGLMEFALLTHDFSVGYVAEVGSLKSPTWVTIVSLWSSLEGSILFWAFVLGVYAAGQALLTRKRFPQHSAWALGMTLLVGVFFCYLVAGVANPFTLVDPAPSDGPGPNPLLQNHVLMVIHPPALYLGYVGMTVPFAMGAAALLAGRITPAWSRALRNAMLVPWGFLTVGIILGGWWSYEVLGWGGYWAWDPVENASFLPWLTSTAFLHSAMLMERKDQLKGWTMTLLMSSFLLTILGTFMTRSGVFNSVHSFTQTPIGPVFLVFLTLMLLFSVLLLAARVDKLTPPQEGLSGPTSRDTWVLAQNLAFATFTFTVLLGTVWPLVNEALSNEQISVGEPYFNRWGVPLAGLIVFLMGVGPALPWGRATPGGVLKRLAAPAVALVLTAIGCLAAGLREPWPVLTFSVSAFALVVTLAEMVAPGVARWRARGESLPVAMVQATVRTRRRFGGYIVHLGVIAIAVGVAASSGWRDEHQLTLLEGETAVAGDFALTYLGAETVQESHRLSTLAKFDVKTVAGREVGQLAPRMNVYAKMPMNPLGDPAVHSSLAGDLYLTLVSVEAEAGAVSVEAIIEPLVGWIWIGGGIMALGTIVAGWPSRKRSRSQAAPTAEQAA